MSEQSSSTDEERENDAQADVDECDHKVHESDKPGHPHDESTKEGDHAQQVPVDMVKEDDNESILSWENLSDDEDACFAEPVLPVRPLGLSRRAGYTNFDDYDVVTVHGVCDDQQTAWTAERDNSDWIQYELFSGLSVRQLDYAYDNGYSARIYDPNSDGITVEANALLDSLAVNRLELPITEKDRPIIWICHDVGGSIVKQALINAMNRQPDPQGQDYPGKAMAMRKMYRRLPLLTSAIIFLGCPHGSESGEDLEDQLFALMCHPRSPLRRRILPKIRHLARQIEQTNLEFTETKVLERAVAFNITTGPERQDDADAGNAAESEQNSAQENEAKKQTAESPKTPGGIFSVYNGGIFHNLGIYYTFCLQTKDHLGLVRGPDPSGPDSPDWATFVSKLFNTTLGNPLNNYYAYLPYQNSLLSLAPPTQVKEYRFLTDGLSRPDLMSWIIEHVLFEKCIRLRQRLGTVYLHAGHRQRVIDMKSVSRQLQVAYDIMIKDQIGKKPQIGCFYFEFDQFDSRRRGIRAMIISFMCTYACRFRNDGAGETESSIAYLRKFKCWSLKDLIYLFLRVQKAEAMRDMTIILGQIDQCDEDERSVFLQSVLNRQKWNCLHFNIIITANTLEGSLWEMLPPDNVISLDEFPLPLDEYLKYPTESGGTEDRLQRLLTNRPEFGHLSPQLAQIFEKFRNVPHLQETVLEWLGSHKSGASDEEASALIPEVLSDTHQKLMQDLISQLSVDRQRIITEAYKWIRYAAEPSTLEILAEAVRLSLPKEIAQLQHFQSPEEFGRLLKQSMEGVILLDGRDTKFSDEAFYEGSDTVGADGKRNQACRSHADMATVCLHYLTGAEGQTMLRSISVESHGVDDDLSWSPIMLPRHSLVSYALRFWTVHYQAAGEYRPSDLASELFEDACKRRVWSEAAYVISNPFTRTQREYISPLPYMAMLGLDDLIRKQIEGKNGQDGRNQDRWLAIAEAARNGHGETVALLLEHTDLDAAGLGEALYWAATYGEGGALDCLISKALGYEGFRWPPFILNRAMAAGLENLASALAQAGYDMNEEDCDGQGRAVHTAVQAGQDRALKILLGSGRVDLTIEDDEGQSVMVLAIQVGNPESIRHLVDAGASLGDSRAMLDESLLNALLWANNEALGFIIDAHIHDNSDIVNRIYVREEVLIPVIEAARRAYTGCVRVLLEKGADPNAADQNGSVLYQTVEQSEAACLVLLEKGANPNQSAAHDPVYDGKDMLLIRAIDAGKKILVEKLLDYGAEINVADPSRIEFDTPLSAAVFCRNYDMVKLLLERGADPNLVSEEKPGCESPLFIAAYRESSPRMAELLVKHGAKFDWVRSDGWSMTHAAYHAHEMLSYVLANGTDVNATEGRNWTALMLAAWANNTQSMEVLLSQADRKADVEVRSTDDTADTALHLACDRGHSEAVRLLLAAGADVNRQLSNGRSPLGLFLESGPPQPACEDIVELMLKRKPNLGLADNEQYTVLHGIMSTTPLSAVMRLVEEGAPVNTFNTLGYNPLATAVSCGNIAVARYLTTVKGSQSDVYHPNFGSILHMAAAKSTLEMVRQLVRTGAEHSLVDPGFGETVLYSAVGNANKKERRSIIQYLVEELAVDINAPGGRMDYPLLRVVREDSEGHSLLKYLLRKGARIDQRDPHGRTAAHWAAIKNRIGPLRHALSKYWADLAARDNYGRTPLHFAAANFSSEILCYILEQHPDGSEPSFINAADSDGWTPLMWACRMEITEVADILVNKYRADVHVRSKDGEWSALRVARLHGWVNVFPEFLVPSGDAEGREDSRVARDNETAPGKRREVDCVGCEAKRIVGQAWICRICEEHHLCFKCIRHSGTMHDPTHTFVDLDEYEKEGSGLDADRSEHASGGESEDEEQESDESESEEDDDDSE